MSSTARWLPRALATFVTFAVTHSPQLDGSAGVLSAHTTTNVYAFPPPLFYLFSARADLGCNSYSTNEPQSQFHKRIGFCLELHNRYRTLMV